MSLLLTLYILVRKEVMSTSDPERTLASGHSYRHWESQLVTFKGLLWGALAALWISPALATVDGPTAAYLAMRDKAHAAVNSAGHLTGNAQDALATSYLHDLQGALRGLVGPFRVDGLPDEGTIQPGDLFEGDLGSDTLDGLHVESADRSVEAVISTSYLLSEWLARMDSKTQDPEYLLPLDISNAFTAELFYTWVFADDVHYYTMAELPVVLNGRNSVAKAVLYTRTSDTVGLYAPDGIAVAVEMEDRVVVLKENFNDGYAIPVLPSCVSQFKSASAKADELLKVYHASPHGDPKLFDRYQQLDDAANLEYQKCFQRLIPAQPYYSALIKRAQTLVNRVKY